MKTRMKKLAVVVMAMTMTMAGTVNMAWAGTSDSVQIGGYTAWGNLEIGSTSVSEITDVIELPIKRQKQGFIMGMVIRRIHGMDVQAMVQFLIMQKKNN